VHGDPANGLKVDAEMLAAAATPATKGIMLNSPCNPTGAMYDRAELEAILSLADERGWWVISDEIYRRITYGSVSASVMELVGARDRLILVDGVAKAYAMTGWRIGWTVAPRQVARAMGALQSHTTSNAAAVSQHAALAAITNREAAEPAIAHMVGELHRRRDAALAVLAEEPRIGVVPPDGAFYLFLDVSAMKGDAREGAGTVFAQHLLERHDVAFREMAS
jgi:aspartate aminotransferase